MAKATSKASLLTTLRIGKVEVGVALFTAHADPKKKLIDFDTAGPSGGVLKMRSVARPVPVEETVERPDEPVERTDPFGGDLFDGAPPPEVDEKAMAASGETAAQMNAQGARGPDGEYGSELVEDDTGEIVPPENVRRGVRLEDGSFVDCTAELASIDEKTKLEAIDVLGFVEGTAVGRWRVLKSYWLGAADEDAPVALRVIFEAIKAARKMALVKITKRSRQSLGVIGWRDGCLMFYELVWAEDFREAPPRAKRIAQAKVSESMVENMRLLVEKMYLPPSAVDELRDDAIALREDLHARALRGEVEAAAADVAAESEDDGLMAQLEASLVGAEL